jgi:hypothetical protein
MKNAPAGDAALRWWHVVALIAAALLVGGLAAWLSREPPLLATPKNAPAAKIERKDSAQAQFIYAGYLNTEAAYKSVAEYFPPDPKATDSPNRYYGLLAQQQLARFYLAKGDLARAAALFTEFTRLAPEDEEFRAFGFAGLALVAVARNDNVALAESMGKLQPLRSKLKAEMASEIDRLERNRQENPPVPKG